jgi:hypothetical protein
MLEIRGSEASTFQRCRLKWKYSWVDKLKPKRPNGKLWFGTLFHKYLEVLYKTDNYLEATSEWINVFHETDTSRMEQVELDELFNLLSKVSFNYDRKWYDENTKQRTIATELTFRIPYNDDLMYYGTIDRIYLDEDNRLWFTDYKTVASLDQYEDNAEMDRQISRYWWAIQKLKEGEGEVLEGQDWVTSLGSRLFIAGQGKEIAGFVYDIIKKDYPHPPEVLKKGDLSKAKNQKTSYDLYLQALNDNNLHIDAYQDILDYLKTKPDGFFRRVQVFRTQGEVDASLDELAEVAKDMVNPRMYRHITKDCSWDCDFKGLCQASMDGSNVDMLINLMFDKEDEN